ncbi:MAG: carbon-nitrogen hydrolase [Nitrososphaerales archaeon]
MKRKAHPSKVKIGLIQMGMQEEKDYNVAKALNLIEQAASKGANVVCLPELFASRYFPQQRSSHIRAEKIPGETTNLLSRSAQKNKVVLIGGSIFEKVGKRTFNTSVVFDHNGRILGKYRKVHIPNDPSFYEQSYFKSGNNYPVFETKFGKIGVLICFDQWYPEAARIMRLEGAEMLFYPTAIGSISGVEQVEGDWKEAWEAVQRGHAIANSTVIAAVNRVSREGEMNFWGGSFVYDQFGKLLVRADQKEGVFIAECDLSLQGDVEQGWGFLQNRKPKTYGTIGK